MIKQLIAATIAGIVLAACNTTEGAGRDIERGGEEIQDAAGKAKK
jgi:predicted small secreted protein